MGSLLSTVVGGHPAAFTSPSVLLNRLQSSNEVTLKLFTLKRFTLKRFTLKRFTLKRFTPTVVKCKRTLLCR